MEFFAGIGLARLGLEAAGFSVPWSNDIEPSKQIMYKANFGVDSGHTYVVDDIAAVKPQDLPDVELAWASFPCTDLSLAGNRRGLAGTESGTFWHLIDLLEALGTRKPPVIALENVVGFATSHGGDDLSAAIKALNELDYSVDVLTLDARRFVPQSRPRLFLVGALRPPADVPDPSSVLRPDWLQAPFGDPALITHRAELPAPPSPLTSGLHKMIEPIGPGDSRWWEPDRARAFVSSLSPVQAARLDALRKGDRYSYRTAYRRTRKGIAVWEIRPDDISGCLRTARGGSSKQAVVQAGRGQVRVRWMTGREYARLMGADNFRLDGIRPSQALFGFGDAVAVPVVAWLAEHYLMPLVLAARERLEYDPEGAAVA
jgi:DNA (cytosine-5)-methyltransferase 1